MQIGKILAISALFISLFQTSECDRRRKSSSNSAASNAQTVEFRTANPQQPNDYRVATKDCFAKKSCLAFVSVEKKLQDEKGLVELSEFLSKKNSDKQDLVIYFFDNFNTAKSFANGNVPPRDLEFYAIGAYRYDEKEEYLKMRVKDQQSSNNRPDWRIVFKRPRS